MPDENYVKTFVPNLSISKSEKGSNDKEWYVKGYASTDAVDTDGESIKPSGIDYSYFKDNGWITYEHEQGAASIIGVPLADKIRTDDHGLYLEGVLLKDMPKAQEVWRLAQSLDAQGAKRALGFSIEGRVTSRDPVNSNIITGMTLTAVTITTHPANVEARWEAIEKSALIGYEINPSEMEGIAALRRESLGVGLKSQVVNAISSLSLVMSRPDRKDILKSAEEQLRQEGFLNRNDLTLILQLGAGISETEAKSFIKDNVEGV